MKEYMKRIVLLLCISLLTAIVCSSQTTYPRILSDSTVLITSKQLKQTNLIFLEHQKYKLINNELDSQIINYKKLVNNYELQDSVYNAKISYLNDELNTNSNKIHKQSTTIKIYRYLCIGLVGGLIFCLWK